MIVWTALNSFLKTSEQQRICIPYWKYDSIGYALNCEHIWKTMSYTRCIDSQMLIIMHKDRSQHARPTFGTPTAYLDTALYCGIRATGWERWRTLQEGKEGHPYIFVGRMTVYECLYICSAMQSERRMLCWWCWVMVGEVYDGFECGW